MKKITAITILATILLYANHADAKIRRVGYPGTPVPGTDYINIQMAHDSASTGDTLLLFPGSSSNGSTLSKKLVVLGYGYFITGSGANANLQNITGPLSVYITLDSTSAGTVLEGIDGLVIRSNHSVKNITIRRCYVSSQIYQTSQTFDNWQFLQCYINSFGFNWFFGKVSGN